MSLESYRLGRLDEARATAERRKTCPRPAVATTSRWEMNCRTVSARIECSLLDVAMLTYKRS